jgi:hypothetical protein
MLHTAITSHPVPQLTLRATSIVRFILETSRWAPKVAFVNIMLHSKGDSKWFAEEQTIKSDNTRVKRKEEYKMR